MPKWISKVKGKKDTRVLSIGIILFLIITTVLIIGSKAQELRTRAANNDGQPALQLKTFTVTLQPTPSPSPKPNQTPMPTPTSAPRPDKRLCNNASALKSRTWGWGTRIVLVKDCVEIQGKITSVASVNDADVHIHVDVDTAYRWQIDNKTKINIEIVCHHTTPHPSIRRVCSGYTNRIPTPKVGDYVQVIGPFVTDTGHGYAEMHPVYSLKVL